MSSSKKSGGSKISLGMLKGKPITTSVPTFTFRFNAEDEELEELYTSPVDETEELSAVDTQETSPSQSPSRCSTPHNTTISRDHSPMKEQLQKLSKRSSSLDESPGSSDTWRLLHELKGKITKTVEEKLSEIKSDKKKSDHPKLEKNSKDNSSISDSEECVGIEKGGDDGSPSHHSTVPTTPESTTPEPEPVLPSDIPKVEVTTPSKTCDPTVKSRKNFFKTAEATLRNRIRPKLSELRQRRKKSLSNEEAVSMSGIEPPLDENQATEKYEAIGEEEVESAVEMQEESLAVQPSEKSDLKQNRQSWSFLGHLQQLSRQREVQALLLWPMLCMVLPVPRTLRDLVLGALIMHAMHCMYQWIIEPGPTALEPIIVPDFNTILQVPAAKEYQPLQKFEGWMNELADDYDPEQHRINKTRSVFLRLEGSILLIYLTRQKVRKRAMWNESAPRLSFCHERRFDLAGCPIKLLPEGLARKRLWSKKYPICVVLHQDSQVSQSIADPDIFKDVIEDEGEDEADDSMKGDEENSEDDTFYMVTSSMVEQNHLFLFARTDREKDEWLRRLVAATKSNSTVESSEPVTPSADQEESDIAAPSTPDTPGSTTSPEAELHRHISKFLQQPTPTREQESAASSAPGSPIKSKVEGEEMDLKEESFPDLLPQPDTAWFNALLGRVLFDVLRDPQWSEWVRDRIQRKLGAIKLPTFMEELTVSHFDLGIDLPVVHRVSSPYMDERGLWVDLDISYEGSASISVETKLNLVKLAKTDSVDSSSSSNRDAPVTVETKDQSKSPMFDSDMEDSAESSSDEDTQDASADDSSAPGTSGGSMGKMLFRMANKITTSRYFQQASEIRYIRRAMEEVSNTRVMVNVELKGLLGVLTLNIPPPPSDRLWYGFRGNPEIRLAAKAKLGERVVTLSHVTEWIEGKLCLEFQKVFVLPNMDDLIIPVMNGKLPK